MVSTHVNLLPGMRDVFGKERSRLENVAKRISTHLSNNRFEIIDTPLLEDRPQVPPPEARKKMLQPEDLAAAALFVAALPPRATVPDLVITPTIQEFS